MGEKQAEDAPLKAKKCEKCGAAFSPKKDYYKLCSGCFKEEVKEMKIDVIKEFEKNIKKHLKEIKCPAKAGVGGKK